MGWERDAIPAIYDAWHEIDRSYRKLAHRGSRRRPRARVGIDFWRVLTVEGLVLPRPAREPVAHPPWADWLEYQPCQVWGHDFERHEALHFDRAVMKGHRCRLVAAGW